MSQRRDVFNQNYQNIENRLDKKTNKFHVQSYSFEETKECLLTANTDQGRYYLDKPIIRTDIKEDQEGVVLLLGFKIVDVNNDCKNLEGVIVDIWHPNAIGEYSGFTEDKNYFKSPNNRYFLRGRQYSDYLGFVEFTTIYPGCTSNRTNHINLKVSKNSKELLTTQIFFPQELNDRIQSFYPYNKNPQCPVKNEDDPIINKYDGVIGGWPKVSPFGNKLIATLTLGVSLI